MTVTGKGSGGTLYNCGSHTDTATVTVRVEVACADSFNGDLRLVDGSVPNEGRLEMCYDDGDTDMSDGDGWGLVCDDYWTYVDAGVACRQLGYAGSAGDRRIPRFGTPPADMSIWLDDVSCLGDETNLLLCPRVGNIAVGQHNCKPKEAVGVRCLVADAFPPRVVQVPLARPIDATGEDDNPDGVFDRVEVLLTFDQDVVVDTAGGTPKVWAIVRQGGKRFHGRADYAGGSGGNLLVFRYDLLSGDGLLSGLGVWEDSLRTRGGTIRGEDSGLDALLGHSGAGSVPFVTAKPAIALTDVNDDGSFGSGDKVELTLTFSESVTVSTTGGTPTVYVNDDDDLAVNAAYVRGSGTTQLVLATASRPSATASPRRRRSASACRMRAGITASAGAWCAAAPRATSARWSFPLKRPGARARTKTIRSTA